MRTVFQRLSIDRLEVSTFGRLQVWFRQVVSQFYPSEAVNGGHDEFLPFDEEEQEFTSTRTAFVNVDKGTTMDAAVARLASLPNAHIARVLSHRPIITEGDEANDKGEEEKSVNQAVRDADGNLVLVNGLVQFHRFFFKASGEPGSDDQDLRDSTKSNPFIPQWFKAEQTISAAQPATSPQTADQDIPF